jgi:hypothetical protein
LVLVDIALGALIVEAVVLAWRATRRAPLSRAAAMRIVAAAAPGAALLLAARAGLAGWPIAVVGLFLAAAWAVHLLDLRLRPIVAPVEDRPT